MPPSLAKRLKKGGVGACPHLSAKRTGRKSLYLILNYKLCGALFFTSSELLLRGPPAKTASRRPTMRNDLGAQRQADFNWLRRRSSLRDRPKRNVACPKTMAEFGCSFCQFWGSPKNSMARIFTNILRILYEPFITSLFKIYGQIFFILGTNGGMGACPYLSRSD